MNRLNWNYKLPGYPITNFMNTLYVDGQKTLRRHSVCTVRISLLRSEESITAGHVVVFSVVNAAMIRYVCI